LDIVSQIYQRFSGALGFADGLRFKNIPKDRMKMAFNSDSFKY
jgi:hypothetical protein